MAVRSVVSGLPFSYPPRPSAAFRQGSPGKPTPLFSYKNTAQDLLIPPKGLTFATEKQREGSLAQLNRAFDYGSKGYRFESYRSHKKKASSRRTPFLSFPTTGRHPAGRPTPTPQGNKSAMPFPFGRDAETAIRFPCKKGKFLCNLCICFPVAKEYLCRQLNFMTL